MAPSALTRRGKVFIRKGPLNSLLFRPLKFLNGSHLLPMQLFYRLLFGLRFSTTMWGKLLSRPIARAQTAALVTGASAPRRA
jgi:hypothetical protein